MVTTAICHSISLKRNKPLKLEIPFPDAVNTSINKNWSKTNAAQSRKNISQQQKHLKELSYNSPFYNYMPCDLACERKRGCGVLVLIQTSLLFSCKSRSYGNKCAFTRERQRFV